MRNPPTREGQVWLQQYTSAFMRWAGSNYADAPALAQATAALESLLERCPEYAPEVERIASIACFASRRGQVPDLIVKLAGVGLEAGAMAPIEGRVSTASAILLLSLAEAEFHADHRLQGLDALRRLEQRLGASTPPNPLDPWIAGRMHAFFGELHELGLEEEQARRAYEAALHQIAPLLDDANARAAYVRAWRDALDERADSSTAADLVALRDLHTLAVSSAIGLARSIGDEATAEERGAAARRAWRMLDEYGPPPDLSPFDVIPVMGLLPTEEARRFGVALVAAIEKRRLQLEKGEVPDGITHADAIAIVQRAQQRQAKLLERQRAVYEIIATLGVALAQRAEGTLDEAESTSIDAMKAALATRLGGPQVCAFALSLEITAARHRERAAHLMDIFMMALAATIETDATFFASPRIRALLDAALATAAGLTLERLGDGTDVHARRRASALLDLLRRPDPPSAAILMPKAHSKANAGPAADAALSAADTLGRILVALRAREDTCALVIQSLGGDVAFLLLSGNDQHLEYCVAGPEYRDAVMALAEAASSSMNDAGPSRQNPDEAVAAAGQRAFEALPKPVQQAIATHRTVLIAPDFRGRQDTVPYELMHDGTAFLAATRIVARFTSLAHMAATLDTRARTPRRRRALVIAAPVVEGYDALDLASLEQEEVTATLTQRGFDAPAIDPARLSSTFLTDRLGYVDLLHVSAHGESAADLEWLVLPRGERLVVDDLLEKPQYHLPFVYLNTCHLGQTRYLGAGVSRGLAYSCAELGAPAVVAHATPVPDNAALRLAIAFYDGVADRSVGEALLDARRTLIEDGESAVALASAMLIGDPDHSVVAARAREFSDLGSDVLDSYMTVTTDEARRERTWSAATTALQMNESPRIEAALSLVQTMAEVRDLDDPAQAAGLDSAIAVSDTLRHLPSRALLRFLKAVHADDGGNDEAPALLEDAIRYLVPLTAFEPAWNNMLSTARQKLAVRKMTNKGLDIRTHMPEGQQDDGSMRQLMEALMGAQQGIEETFGAATVRDVEHGIDDILLNAVVTGHPNRFSDAPETVAFARQVAQKLERRGFLPATARLTAPPMLAGLLRYLWDTQNLNYLAPEVAEAQSGAARALVDDLRANWAPPDGQPWYPLVEPAARLVDEVLTFIAGLGWEDVYKHLDPQMNRLADQLKAMLEQVRAQHPAALGGCTAYVCGTLMAKNTFSPLDGSVPESIGERMTKVYHALDADNESRYFGYLAKGFEAIRNRPVDELARWRMEPDESRQAPPAKRPPNGARPRRPRKRR